MFLTQVSSKDREFVQRLELSGNESFHRHISGSSVTPDHCADWEPHPQHTVSQHPIANMCSVRGFNENVYFWLPFQGPCKPSLINWKGK